MINIITPQKYQCRPEKSILFEIKVMVSRIVLGVTTALLIGAALLHALMQVRS